MALRTVCSRSSNPEPLARGLPAISLLIPSGFESRTCIDDACQRYRNEYFASGTEGYVTQALETLSREVQPGDVVTVVTAEQRMPHLDFVNEQMSFLRSFAAQLRGMGAQLLLIGDVPKLPLPWYQVIIDAGCFTAATSAPCETSWYAEALIPYSRVHMHTSHSDIAREHCT